VTTQKYTEFGDAVIIDDHWLCEHANEDGSPAPSRLMTDRGSGRTVSCEDCGTVWVAWTNGVKRLAKPVVMRMS
jgi:hypothetical protein